MKEVPGIRKFYSIRDVAEILGLAEITVYGHCKEGKIPSVLLGHRRLIPRAYINELIEKANLKSS